MAATVRAHARAQVHYHLPKSAAHPDGLNVRVSSRAAARGTRDTPHWAGGAQGGLALTAHAAATAGAVVAPGRLTSVRVRRGGRDTQVWREYEDFITELTALFPHEAQGIRGFYDDCWKVCRPATLPCRPLPPCLPAASASSRGQPSGAAEAWLGPPGP